MNQWIAFGMCFFQMTCAFAADAKTGARTELHYRKQGNGYLLVLNPGQKVVQSLIELATREKITAANFNAIGAVRNVVVSYYDLQKKDYETKTFEAPGEVVALTGSISVLDKNPAIHAHIAVTGPNYQVYVGHLQEAEVSLTLEIFITASSGTIIRHADPQFPGVKTIDLDAK